MWKNIGHFFATLAQKVLATKATVEAVTADIPVYGPEALSIENVVYGLFGEIAGVLGTGTAEAKAALTTAGINSNYLAAVQDVLTKNPTVVAMAQAAPVKTTTA